MFSVGFLKVCNVRENALKMMMQNIFDVMVKTNEPNGAYEISMVRAYK
jgi:hypothetical protein